MMKKQGGNEELGFGFICLVRNFTGERFESFWKIILFCFLIVWSLPGISFSEVQVNTYTNDDQYFPSVAMDSAGNFVIAWASLHQDGGDWGVYARRYDSFGSPVGGEFQVNTFTPRNQFNPSAAMDSAGNFVIAWDSYYQNDPESGIYAQRYNSSGSQVGGEFHVNTFTQSGQSTPSVAMDSVGNFVIAWQSFYQDGGEYGVYARRYDSSGSPVGGEFQVNTTTAKSQRRPSVAMDSGGNFVITWEGRNLYVNQYEIYARMYDGAGNPLTGEFQVSTTTAGTRNFPSVAMDSSGNFVIAWEDSWQDGSHSGIYARRYDSSGSPVGGEFRVNTYTADAQYRPSVAMDSAGNFVIAWASLHQDGSGRGIFAQQYDSSGSPVGGEFQVNTTTANHQNFPSVAMDSAGNFVIAWQSYLQDGSGYGIYAQNYYGTAPTWPEGSTLNPSYIGLTRLSLIWTPAVHYDGVAEYLIYQDDLLSGTIEGNVTTVDIESLSPNTGYFFKVEACDANENCSTDGPYVSVWTLTPTDAIQLLIDQIKSLNLQSGIENSLDAKLDATEQALSDLRENNDVAAINALQAFINAVEAQRGKEIPEGDADALIADAQEIIDVLSST
jgi:hypothetical protein